MSMEPETGRQFLIRDVAASKHVKKQGDNNQLLLLQFLLSFYLLSACLWKQNERSASFTNLESNARYTQEIKTVRSTKMKHSLHFYWDSQLSPTFGTSWTNYIPYLYGSRVLLP